MSIIGTNPSMEFKTPSSNVEVKAIFISTEFFKITSNGILSGSDYLKSLPDGSIDLVIPSIFDGTLVTSIGDFGRFQSLKTVIIPNTVTTIGGMAFTSAFIGCLNLKSVVIPDSVTEIGSDSFAGCTSLTSVNIPSSVTKIRTVSELTIFRSCTALTSINVDPNNSNFKSVDGVLFSKDGESILIYPAGKIETNYIIPDGVINIESGSLSGTALTNINIPNSVTSIGSNAFYTCTSLTSVNIPSSVTGIYTGAFSKCTSLTSITIDKPVGSITGSPWGCPNVDAIKWLR